MRSLQQFWSVRRIGEDKVTMARLGSLRLWVARANQQWGFTSHYGEDDALMDFAQVPEDVVPEDLQWSYFLFKTAPRDYVFEAKVAERPFILRCTERICIPAGESSSFYFTIPVSVGLRILRDQESWELGTIASIRMKQSWFGSSVDGILCHANSDAMVLHRDQMEPKPNEVVFNLEISNLSRKGLFLDKVCLDLTPAGLYCGKNHMYGSRIHLEYHDLHQDCILKYSDGAPGFEEDLLELRTSGEFEKRDFAKRILSCCHNS